MTTVKNTVNILTVTSWSSHSKQKSSSTKDGNESTLQIWEKYIFTNSNSLHFDSKFASCLLLKSGFCKETWPLKIISGRKKKIIGLNRDLVYPTQVSFLGQFPDKKTLSWASWIFTCTGVTVDLVECRFLGPICRNSKSEGFKVHPKAFRMEFSN